MDLTMDVPASEKEAVGDKKEDVTTDEPGKKKPSGGEQLAADIALAKHPSTLQAVIDSKQHAL